MLGALKARMFVVDKSSMGGEMVLRWIGPLCLIVGTRVGWTTVISGRLLRLVKALARSIEMSCGGSCTRLERLKYGILNGKDGVPSGARTVKLVRSLDLELVKMGDGWPSVPLEISSGQGREFCDA